MGPSRYLSLLAYNRWQMSGNATYQALRHAAFVDRVEADTFEFSAYSKSRFTRKVEKEPAVH